LQADEGDALRSIQSSLTVFHAWDTPPYVYAGLPYISSNVWSAMEEAVKEQLDATLTEVREHLPRAQAALVRGPAAFEILAEIDRTKVDLVVLGTHGRRGLNRVLLGSVAEKVVRSSSVPVLTVRGGV
jgi:nucleotide-binding universal stress UspA family protein